MSISDAPDRDELLRRLSGELARLPSWEDVAAYVTGAAVQLLGGNKLQIRRDLGFSGPVIPKSVCDLICVRLISERARQAQIGLQKIVVLA